MERLQVQASRTLDLYTALSETELSLPFISYGISAGFPSAALDYIDLTIDMNQYLVKHPSATFYGRVKGDSMRDAGISDGDLLVIDKSIEPQNGKIAVCCISGEFTLKRIRLSGKNVWLMPANSDYQPIKVEEHHELIVWGIVTYVIKTM